MATNRLMQRFLRWKFDDDVPADWRPHLDALPFVATLTDDEQRRLVQLGRMFESVVRFDGREGVVVDETMRRSVILQACRLILALGFDPYRYVHRVTIAPGTFTLPSTDGAVRVHGAAESGGHVALSWAETELGASRDDDGRNVVYHEFAHVLDGYDGVVDGRPDLRTDVDRAMWVEAAGSSFRRRRRSKRRRELIDAYGATSPVEFFAEATEVFFEQPEAMVRREGLLYEALSAYFQQDPAGAFDDI